MPHRHRKIHPGALLVLLASIDGCADPDPISGSSGAATTSAGESTSQESDTSGDLSTSQTGETAPATTGASGCAATHLRIGWRAELLENYHGVAGTAEIVDDCTIVVSDFTYDGTGIDVRFYGGRDEDYAGGFAISDNLLKPGGYTGETMVLTLPSERNLDDLDGLSVWCVDVEIDFGSGVFTAP